MTFWMPKGRADDGLVAVARQLHERQDLLHHPTVLDLGAPRVARPEALAQHAGGHAGVARHQEVLQHRHVSEQLAVLERARQPEPRHRVRPGAGDVAALEQDAAAARPVDAADAVEDAGLARAVGTDQRQQLAGADRERHIRQHAQAAEGQRQPLDAERDLSHTSAGCGGTA